MAKQNPDRADAANEAPEETGVTEVLPTEALPTEALATEVLAPAAPEPPTAEAAPARAPLAEPAPLAAPAPAAEPPARPTIRWGALVWALLYGAIAGITVWLLISPERRDAAADWIGSVHPLVIVLYGVIALGVVIALFGIVGLIRRGERARRGHQAAGSSRSPSGVSSGGIGQASS